jgi:hypothetical protein
MKKTAEEDVTGNVVIKISEVPKGVWTGGVTPPAFTTNLFPDCFVDMQYNY